MLTIEEELIRLDPLWKKSKAIPHDWVERLTIPKVSMSSIEYDEGLLRQLAGARNEKHYFSILNNFYKVCEYEWKSFIGKIKWEYEKEWKLYEKK